MTDPYMTLEVRKAVARLIYERETGRDWHVADLDPGEDPYWLNRAKETEGLQN